MKVYSKKYSQEKESYKYIKSLMQMTGIQVLIY